GRGDRRPRRRARHLARHAGEGAPRRARARGARRLRRRQRVRPPEDERGPAVRLRDHAKAPRAHLRPPRARSPPEPGRLPMTATTARQTRSPYLPTPMVVAEVTRDLEDVFTLSFDVPEGFPFRPGQFNMLWVHGVGEV